MKLLKKIAPIAMVLAAAGLFLGASAAFAGASTLNTWKTSFPASSTVVVVGANAANEDSLAAVNIANELGLQATGGSTVTGEKYLFEKTTNKLNVGDALTDLRTSITDEQLPTILADGVYLDDNNDEFDYTQKITMAAGLELTHFADKDYNDKTPTLGIPIDRDAEVFDYTLDFSTSPDCGVIPTTTINMLGKDYYVIEADDSCDTISLLDSGVTATVIENAAAATIQGHTVSTSYIGEDEAVLTVDGKDTNSLGEGEVYKLSDEYYIGVKDIQYVAKDVGNSRVVISLGSGRIDLEDAIHDGTAGDVRVNDDLVDGFTVVIDDTDDALDDLVFTWAVDDQSFIAGDTSITLPGLGGVKLMTTGMVFPTGETIAPVADGTDAFVLDVPIASGDAEIPILYTADEDSEWDAIGAAADDLLITAADDNVDLDLSVNDNSFVVSEITGTDVETAESYFVEPTIDTNTADDFVITLKDAVTGDILCEDVIQGETCEFGDGIELTVTAVDDDAQTAILTAKDTEEFDVVYSADGARIALPVGDVTDATWDLIVEEADKEGVVSGGADVTFELGFNVGNEASVTDVTATAIAGLALFQTGDGTKIYVGYTESDLASQMNWDKSADQYSADMTYYGTEVYGNYYIAGTSATAGTAGGVAITDADVTASIKTTKNIVAIGGSAINSISADLLGLTYPTYGGDTAWQTATGVTSTGKAFIKLFENKYATGKTAMLVAGWEGADTQNAAKALTTPINFTGSSALIDTVNLVQINA